MECLYTRDLISLCSVRIKDILIDVFVLFLLFTLSVVFKFLIFGLTIMKKSKFCSSNLFYELNFPFDPKKQNLIK